MKKQLHKLDTLTTELGQTMTKTEEAQVKGGFLTWTCEEKRDINGRTYMRATSYTFGNFTTKF